MSKLRPCDCRDIMTASMLEEQGLSINNNSIFVKPNVVILKIDRTTIEIPMNIFKTFSEWYLTEQKLK